MIGKLPNPSMARPESSRLLAGGSAVMATARRPRGSAGLHRTHLNSHPTPGAHLVAHALPAEFDSRHNGSLARTTDNRRSI
jgi:hypothetical protein